MILLVLVPFVTFASVFQFGPTFSYNVPVELEAEKMVDFENFDFSAFTVGADFRFNPLSFLQFQAEARGSFDKELKLKQMEAYAAANIRFKLLFTELTVGGGLKSEIVNNDGVWTFDGNEYTDFPNMLDDASIYYSAGFNVNLGKVTVATEAIFPTSLTFVSMNEEKMQSVFDAITPDFSKTQLSVGLLVNIF